MAHEGEIYWYDPDPRAILPLDQFHISRSLKRSLKRVWIQDPTNKEIRPFIPTNRPQRSQKRPFEIRFNTDFLATITACADPSRKGSWIDDQILRAYTDLHKLGWAYSVETWQDGKLVGGLYGVAIRGLFAGEAMFSHTTDASKVALVALVAQLKQQGFSLLDVQFQNDHLMQFGVTNIPQREYKDRLQRALTQEVVFS